MEYSIALAVWAACKAAWATLAYSKVLNGYAYASLPCLDLLGRGNPAHPLIASQGCE
jgi:hypothetical protein